MWQEISGWIYTFPGPHVDISQAGSPRSPGFFGWKILFQTTIWALETHTGTPHYSLRLETPSVFCWALCPCPLKASIFTRTHCLPLNLLLSLCYLALSEGVSTQPPSPSPEGHPNDHFFPPTWAPHLYGHSPVPHSQKVLHKYWLERTKMATIQLEVAVRVSERPGLTFLGARG